MRCKKTIVVSVANCQVNGHSHADLKVPQQESETKSEIESSSAKIDMKSMGKCEIKCCSKLMRNQERKLAFMCTTKVSV